MTKPIVSAIVPTHNRAGSLRRALDSIYAQQNLGSAFDVEVIVVDDASSDSTPDVVMRYPSARYLRQERRRGSRAAMNEGIRRSSGRYVAFLDDDDEWLPCKLAVQVPRLEADPDLGAVYSQLQVRFGDKEWLQPATDRAPSGWVFAAMLMENCCGGSLLIRRTAFDKAGHFDESFESHADYDLWLRIAFHFPLLFIPGPVQIYNISGGGQWLTAASNGIGDRDRIRVTERGLRMLPDAAEYADLKQRARAHARLQAMSPFVMTGQLARAWPKLLAAAAESPWIVRHPLAQDYLNWAISTMIAGAPSAAAAIRELRAQLQSAVRAGDARDRVRFRPVLGAIWAQMAIAVAGRHDEHDREAGGAAARSLLYAPGARPGRMLRLIARGVLGRRTYACLKWSAQQAARTWGATAPVHRNLRHASPPREWR